MKFEMTKPCEDCPFLKVGGIRLTPGRVHEIAGAMLSTQGQTFTCHKTTVDDPDTMDQVNGPNAQHCAGGLIFAEKNGNATQMMRIMERIRQYDAKKLMSDKKTVATVFDSLAQMLRVNRKELEAERKPRKDREAAQVARKKAAAAGRRS